MGIQARGQWLGLEYRSSLQTPMHDEIAINMDYSRGTKAARPGIKTYSSYDALIFGAQIAVVEDSSGYPYVLRVGNYLTTNAISASVYSYHDGSVITPLISLPACPPDPEFRCTLLRGNFDGAPVVFVYTNHATYYFNPSASLSTITKLVPATHAIKLKSINARYWMNSPIGKAAAWQRGRYWSCGWETPQTITLDGEMPANQEDIPKEWMIAGNTQFVLPAGAYAYSDGNDAAGIWAPSVGLIDSQAKIVAPYAFREALYFFTTRGIWSVYGDFDTDNLQAVESVSSVACAAPHAIVDDGRGFYFLSQDGVWVYDGETMVQKISKPIDWLFTGIGPHCKIPEPAKTLCATLGYPWRIDASKLHLASAVHVAKKNQIWFAVPVEGNSNGNTVCLVWDVAQTAWSLHCRRDMGEYFSGAIEYKGEVLLSRDGYHAKVGATYDDSGAGIPVVCCTTKLPGQLNQQRLLPRKVRLRMMAHGKKPATNPPQYFLEAEDATWDHEVNGSTNTDRALSSGDIYTTPDWREENTSYLGTNFRLDGGTLGTSDWFTSRIDPSSCRGRWFRLGWVDDANTEDRAPVIEVESFDLEVASTSGPG